MATVKVKFCPSSVDGREGTVYYQLLHQRVSRRIGTGHRLFSKEWDGRRSMVRLAGDGRRMAYLQLVQDKISWEVRRMRMLVMQKEECFPGYDIDELAGELRRMPACQSVFCFLRLQIGRKERMRRLGTAKTYSDAYRKFFLFRNGCDLSFTSLTADVVESYEAWLFGQGLMMNTIAYYLRTLRTLYHKAVEEGLAEDRDIFRRVRTSCVMTVKRAMSLENIRDMARLPLRQGSPLAFARDMFLFSLYTRGMAFVDMAFLRKSSIRYGMLCYNRRKTNQSMTVEWESPAQRIVDAYAGKTKNTPFLLPIIMEEDGNEYMRYKQVLQNVNRNLNKIGEMLGLKMPLTLYVARHSWATAALKLDIPLAAISEGMGHNSYKTTQIYLESIGTGMVNQANRTVMQAILE